MNTGMAEPIAIVGSACRFPGSAGSPPKLWDLLKHPRDVIREFPQEKLNLSNFYSQDGETHGCTDVQNKSYLLQEDCRLFDAAFFRINPKEAHGMDPQQRILLETTFEALEGAGWPLNIIEGSSTAVYVGVMTSDSLPTYTATGLARSILSNRISYCFNLKGPSMTIDTACSSSLVALHLAVQCLRNGEAAQAIVAGTSLLLDSPMYIAESKLHMLSPDSRSRMWDKDANGYARGEGCAAVILKPLSKAIQDNDHIECIIRETALNSDGRTNGITMPSSSAQTALIRKTYEKAGLDPLTERCQYFECHGTGTLAGDPVEARAIKEAFFPNRSGVNEDAPLYCGSVKTIIGHLEGCAGLAGVLKASLALQNRAIPPNMHFNQLNPEIEPYYDNLCVPTSLLPWPKTNGKPRRASVNNFGFGGTNAHAILESYQPPPGEATTDQDGKTVVFEMNLPRPFVFSARSRSSLLHTLKEVLEHVRQNPSLDLDALSWILHSRRTAFSIRTAIAASNRQRLLNSLEKQINIAEASADAPLGVRARAVDPNGRPPSILGVFTGQGAQWANMGRELMTQCPLFRESLEKCENALRQLPEAPSWSLMQELATEGTDSRISQAQFSQPLCTAIQIGLVDLLRAANINFDRVVGHSSGEIGAAYAAGVLDVRDAIGIAYYRGLVASLAKGAAGQEGGMMAVGMSFDDSAAFCSQPRFTGRIGVAASNAPSSVTLSGDLDAIHEAKKVLDEDNIFARLLRVDTAYHSHHMLRCAEAYMTYLKQLDVRFQPPREGCTWSSSVRVDADLLQEPLDHLKDQYWVDNMVRPVLFSQALEYTLLCNGSFTLALEVGPHPALKTPVSQTLKRAIDSSIPYSGCLQRGENDIESMEAALGLLWSHLGPSFVDFAGWRNAFHESNQPRMLKNLPSYAWDHDQIYWRESRLSHNYRLGVQQPHELLGRLREDCQHEKTWRNVLRLNEIPWVRGHIFQGQVIFPGAGYVSMAVQAANELVHGAPIKLIEIQDMNIPKALILDEDSTGVETIFTVRSHGNQSSTPFDSVLEADFTCYSCSDGRTLDKSCDGRLLIHLGQPGSGDLPPGPISQAELPPLDVDRFFSTIADLGIVYDGVFRTLHRINRMWGHSKASASWAKGDLGEQYALHPALLDVGFQAGFAAFASIAEKAMGTTYLPAGIRRIIVDPTQQYQGPLGETSIEIESHLARSSSMVVEVDLHIWKESSKVSGIQVDGLILKAIAEPQPSDDRLLFAKTVWDIDASCGLPSPPPVEAREDELEYIDAVERTALFFLQSLSHEIRPEEIASCKWQHQALLRAIGLFLSPVREGRHAVLKTQWLDDTRETIRELAQRYPESVDLALLTAVGENLPSVVRGQSEMLEHMLNDNLLGRLYMEGRGFAACNEHVATFMRQISHKHPRTKILEIGAGTGGTTRSVLDAIGNAYSSYVYTDISAGFFEKAAEKFADQAHKMDFKMFNAEHPPSEQGFTEGTYDIIIAANVLHATRKLSETMRHVRSLLRPGGFLVAVEVTGTMLREPGLMGGLEGWWLGVNDGRFPCPGISAKGWHDLLQASGFSGVDSIVYDMPDVSRHNCSVFVTQAVDEQFELLRDPLATIDLVPEARVVIVGGQTLPVSKAVRRAEKLLKRWTRHVTTYASIDALDPSEILPESSILCLAELDKAIFSETMSARRLENLQELLGNAQNVLWVTSGRFADDPYCNMMTGIGRALSFELPHVNIQFIDFDQELSWDMEMAVQYLLRMVLLSSPQYLDHNMLWVQEPEIKVNDGTTLVPRVLRDDAANEGLNAKRRRITKLVDQSEKVEVSYGSSQASLVKSNLHTVPADSVEIDIELSVALHSRHETPCFLCFGYSRGNGLPALARAETESSTTIVKETSVFELPKLFNCDAEKLVAVGSALIASHVLSNSPTNGTILVHEPTTNIAEAIAKAAMLAKRNVLFVASTAEKERAGWITVHPLAQSRAIRRLIPDDTTILWRFSSVSVDNILQNLPVHCVAQTFDPSSMSQQQAPIWEACETAASAKLGSAVPVVKISDVSQDYHNRGRLSTVLDWRRTGPVNVIVPPIDARGIFSADKTYFMAGMTGELGQSLCRFMVNCGARHIVLASRNPVNDANWLEDLRMIGAEVKVVKMDVTNRAQVVETASMIRNTMPRVGGVANAALVLEDSLFVNATVANVERQLKPKVDGTVYLDEEFAHDNLDFFIAFSSLGSVYGNAGQSIYHAANMFMTSLVEKRRRRGQAGSVINIGMVVDVGYVAKSARSGTNIEEHLRSQFYTPLAETEFHHLVLQAVLSGHPSSVNADVTMGIQHFIDDPDAPVRPHWYSNPRFSHMIFPPTTSNAPSQSSTATQQLREMMEKAESVAEATEAFQELFCKKIESMMKVPAAAIDVNAPLSDLGLDSLLAVEIRAWLLKEMHVDVPVLKILGRDPMSSICSSGAQNLLKDRTSVTESTGTRGAHDLPAEPDTPQAALDMNQSNTIDQSDSSSTRIESAQDLGSTDSSSSSGITTPAESAAPSASVSPKIQQDDTAPSASSVSNSAITPANLEEPKSTLEYKRTELMSFSQASLYFLHGFLDDATTFNVTAQYDIKGHLNVTRFARALTKTLARHEAYQTCFFTEPGNLELKQGIVSNTNSDPFLQRHSTEAEDVNHEFQALTQREWKLASGQTFQTVLITHAPESHTVIFGCHHIIMDGMSWHVFLQDLDRAYQMLPFNTIPRSYMDFSRQQREALEGGQLVESIGYWMRELDPIPTVLPLLPLAQTRSRKSRRSYGNNIVQRELSAAVVQRVKEASHACRATPMQFYLAVVQTLFARLLELDEICIGVTDAGRAGNENFSGTIGHFTNLLPMRFSMSGERSFAELVQDTARTVLNGYNHAQVPIDVILQRLEIPRSSAYTPLFQVAFNYRIGDLLQRTLGNCSMDLDKYVDAKTPYDLTFNVTQIAEGGHLVEVSSNDYLYSTAATEIVLDTFVGLLQSLSVDQYAMVRDCKLRGDEHIEQALRLGRGPTVQHPWPETLTERFHQVRSAFPGSVAIKDENGSMTYDQLALRAGAIAAALITAGAGLETRVAVLCEPSIDTYAVMLAILRIGAVYVPLDLSLPSARHRTMIEACRPRLLVFHSATAAAAAQFGGNGGDISTVNLSELTTCLQEPPSAAAVGDSFLLFTSGSTGTPKGILLSQSGIMNYAASKSAMLGLGRVKVLQQSSTGFDMSIAQAFNAFANGGTLVVASSKARGDPVMIAQLMVAETIELTICTPSEYLMYTTYANDSLRQCTSWRYACSGGEAVVDRLVSDLQRLELPHLTLTDCYGPTEISCAATFRTIPLQTGIEGTDAANSVGKAISNTSVYIVGKNGEALPVGFPGEVCIGGRGVARGYLDAKLSSSKFVPNPFAMPDDIAQELSVMYKTGDKGCLQEDGSLTFLGRTDGDTLTKLRGLRIELNEVANVILHAAQGSLADAVVTVRGQPEFLVAHVVFTREGQLSESKLDTLLAHLPLPRYMIPSMIIPLDRLPITPNGKVDRKALAQLPLPTQRESNEKKSLTVPEGELRLIWKDILGEAAGHANIGPETDFFTVGGSSLLLVRLQNAFKERMGVQMPLQALYQASTLGKMAAATSNERSQILTDTINWAAEILVPAHILNTACASVSPALRKHLRHVLLTGSTGFLGSEILAALITDDEVEKIHCIAVPADARSKIPSHGKVVVYSGSLLSPNLGLSGKEKTFLQSNIDQIIHAGANGHCLNNYSSVRQPNYLATQFLVTLALPRRVPFHFISSGRVVLQSGECATPPVSMAAHQPPADGSQGFTSSKWASECFLENVARETGLPVVIHRSCSVIGTRAPHDDAMNSVIRYSLLSRTVPAVPNAEGFFDFKDVVAVAAEIACGPVAEGSISFRHHSSGVPVPFSQLAQRMESLHGGKFEVVSMADWIRSVVKLGIEDLIVSYLEANVAGGGKLTFPYLGMP